MNTRLKYISVAIAAVFLAVVMLPAPGLADMDWEREDTYWKTRKDRRDREEQRFKREDTAEKRIARVEAAKAAIENSAYGAECADCHFLYQPWLLPARSWERVMQESNDHFGEDLALDPEAISEITAYLVANATDYTDVKNEWTRRRQKGKTPRLMKRLGPEVPVRITELPYIVKEHDDIASGIFKRPSIQSFSNCSACHTRAEYGDYEEDRVKIPAH